MLLALARHGPVRVREIGSEGRIHLPMSLPPIRSNVRSNQLKRLENALRGHHFSKFRRWAPFGGRSASWDVAFLGTRDCSRRRSPESRHAQGGGAPPLRSENSRTFSENSDTRSKKSGTRSKNSGTGGEPCHRARATVTNAMAANRVHPRRKVHPESWSSAGDCNTRFTESSSERCSFSLPISSS